MKLRNETTKAIDNRLLLAQLRLQKQRGEEMRNKFVRDVARAASVWIGGALIALAVGMAFLAGAYWVLTT